MTLKRVQVHGYIEVPEGWAFPDHGSRIAIDNVEVRVTGKHDDMQARRKDQTEQVLTLVTVLNDGASVGNVRPPEKSDPNQASIDD